MGVDFDTDYVTKDEWVVSFVDNLYVINILILEPNGTVHRAGTTRETLSEIDDAEQFAELIVSTKREEIEMWGRR